MATNVTGFPVGQPTIGWAIACTRKGLSHRNTLALSQDAHAIWTGNTAGQDGLAIAVADGHGDKRHPLSHIGSAVAARVAVEALAQLWQGIVFNPDAGPNVLFQARSRFASQVHQKWSHEIASVAGYHQQFQSTHGNVSGGGTLLEPYGTTLLCSLIMEGSALVAQIGDGCIVLINEDGEIEFPLGEPSDDGGNVTNSMCSARAIVEFNTGVLNIQRSGLLLHATDGFVNSFSSVGELRNALRSLLGYSKEYKYDDLLQSVPKWLEHYTCNGSGDDISLVLTRILPPHQYSSTYNRELNERRDEIQTKRSRAVAIAEQQKAQELQELKRKKQDLDREAEKLAIQHKERDDVLLKSFIDDESKVKLLCDDQDVETSRKNGVLDAFRAVFRRDKGQ